MNIKRGVKRVAKRPPAPPFATPIVVYRDALSGRFAPTPAKPLDAPPRRVRLKARPQRATDFRVIRKVLVWDEGHREVIEVKIKCQSARLAQLAGAFTAAALRDFEAEVSLHALQEENPVRAKEYELAQMHREHNRAKGRRAAVSRKKNAAARAADEAKGIRIKKKAPV